MAFANLHGWYFGLQGGGAGGGGSVPYPYFLLWRGQRVGWKGNSLFWTA